MLSADEIVQNTACVASGGGLQQFLCGWQSAMGFALVVSAVFLAAFYILSVLFRNEGLKGFVKLELSELFITVLLVIVLMGAVGAVSNLKVGLVVPANQIPPTVSADSSIYNVTQAFFDGCGNYISSFLEMNYVLGVIVDTFASVQSQPRPMGVGLVAPPFAGLASPIKQLLYSMSTTLAIAFVVNYAQLYVYLFALYGSLHYYIPLGIVLRSFTPTRRIGGSLIGLGVSFLFVFPALYSLNYMMFFNTNGPMESMGSFIKHRFDAQSAGFGNLMEKFYKEKATMGFIDLVVSSIGDMGQLISGLIGGIFTVAMVLPISVVGLAMALSFMSVFNIMMMVQATRAISKIIGEEVDISTLTRMV